MDKQKRILEMAKDICRVKLNCNDVCNPISACDALKYAERAIEAGYSKQSGWISVEDRLPDKQTECVCRCVFPSKPDYAFFMVLEYYPNKRSHFQHEAIGHMRVTHWINLPEFPGEKGGAQK